MDKLPDEAGRTDLDTTPLSFDPVGLPPLSPVAQTPVGKRELP